MTVTINEDRGAHKARARRGRGEKEARRRLWERHSGVVRRGLSLTDSDRDGGSSLNDYVAGRTAKRGVVGRAGGDQERQGHRHEPKKFHRVRFPETPMGS